MNILVTGATGFIGRKLVPSLIKQGHKVYVLSRHTKKAQKYFDSTCIIREGDMAIPDTLHGCCENIDIVYQLVGLSGGKEEISEKEFERYRFVNVQCLKHIVEEAKRAHVKKFIQVSSIAALGNNSTCGVLGNEQKFISDKTVCDPITPYQVSKREAEIFLLDQFKNYGFPAIIIRPTWVYGPEGEGGFGFYMKLINLGFFPRIGKHDPLVSYCYVDDLITNLILLSQDKGKIGEIYIATTEKSIGYYQMIHIIAETMNKHVVMIPIPKGMMVAISLMIELMCCVLRVRPIVTRRNIYSITSDRVYDLSKNNEDIGFTSSVTMEEGIRITVSNEIKSK